MGQSKREAPVWCQDDILCAACRQGGRRGVFFAGAALEEDAGGFDQDRFAAVVHTDERDAQVPGILGALRMPGVQNPARYDGTTVDQRLAIDLDRLVNCAFQVVSGM